MSLTLSAETQERLKEAAKRRGQDLDSLIGSLLDAEENDFAETVAGIKRGLADVEAGRVTPIGDVVAETRARLNLPAEWPDAYLKTANDKNSAPQN